MPGSLSHFVVKGLIGYQLGDSSRQARDITYIFEKAVHAIGNQFRNTSDPSGDRRHSASHGFERGKAERFHFARHQNDVGESEQALDLILLAQKLDVILYAKLSGEVLRRSTFGSVTHHEEPHIRVFAYLGQY